MSTTVEQVKFLRNLLKLMLEQQESVLTLVSDILDKLETDLSADDAEANTTNADN